MEVPIYVVDTFSPGPFRGSPAAVCLSQSPLAIADMKRIADETRQNCTAFVSLEAGKIGIRWFSSERELQFGGTGTLAAAFVLFELGLAGAGEPIRFQTLGGDLFAWREGTELVIDLPAEDLVPTDPSAALRKLFSTEEVLFFGRSDATLVVELAYESALRARSNVPFELWDDALHSLVLTAPGVASNSDYCVREFSPYEADGSAAIHRALGPFWAKKLGKSRLSASKLSARGGAIGIQIQKDRVHLFGEAYMTLRGTLGF